MKVMLTVKGSGMSGAQESSKVFKIKKLHHLKFPRRRATNLRRRRSLRWKRAWLSSKEPPVEGDSLCLLVTFFLLF